MNKIVGMAVLCIGLAIGMPADAKAQPSFCDRNESPVASGSDHVTGHQYIAACGTDNTGNGGCDASTGQCQWPMTEPSPEPVSG